MAFMRILSPNNAPPVLRFEGSTDTIPKVLSGKSIKNLLTNSSIKEDLPAPPVPVIPRTGTFTCAAFVCIFSKIPLAKSGKFSAAEIKRAIAFGSFLGI
jgi:hypothetical protein